MFSNPRRVSVNFEFQNVASAAFGIRDDALFRGVMIAPFPSSLRVQRVVDQRHGKRKCRVTLIRSIARERKGHVVPFRARAINIYSAFFFCFFRF